MAQSIFEEMGGRYEKQGDYILPCLTVPPEEEKQEILTALQSINSTNNIGNCK